MITSKQNDFIKQIKSLSDKKYRDRLNLYVALGIKLTREAIASSQEVVSVVCTPEASDILGELPIQKTLVSPEVFASLSEEKSPQGALAVIKKPTNEICKPKGSCIFLDGVSDSGNVGAIIRTAVASGYTDVYLADCADAYSPKSVRASMSGIYSVRTHIGSRDELLPYIDLPICVADMFGQNVFDSKIPSDFCLVIGNEAHGVSEQLKKIADYTVKIPMQSGIESLNAAVSAGILMYALKKQ